MERTQQMLSWTFIYYSTIDTSFLAAPVRPCASDWPLRLFTTRKYAVMYKTAAFPAQPPKKQNTTWFHMFTRPRIHVKPPPPPPLHPDPTARYIARFHGERAPPFPHRPNALHTSQQAYKLALFHQTTRFQFIPLPPMPVRACAPCFGTFRQPALCTCYFYTSKRPCNRPTKLPTLFFQ